MDQLHALNEVLRRVFEEWLRRAPPSYKKLRQLTDSWPVAVRLKYGQNRRICDLATIPDDVRQWDEQTDYTKQARISMALAFHIT